MSFLFTFKRRTLLNLLAIAILLICAGSFAGDFAGRRHRYLGTLDRNSFQI